MRKEAAMLISDLMTTALITASPGDLVNASLYDMKLAQIRHLPVIDERGHLVGIVSDRDVLLSLGSTEDKNIYMRDIMSQQVETICEDASVEEGLAILLEKRIGSLPVVGQEGQLVGVVTETDFLRLAQDLLAGGSQLSEQWRD